MKCPVCRVTMTPAFNVDTAVTTHTCPSCGRGDRTWDASVGAARGGLVPSAVIEPVHPVEPADASTDVTEAWLESSTTEYEPEPLPQLLRDSEGRVVRSCADTLDRPGCGRSFTLKGARAGAAKQCHYCRDLPARDAAWRREFRAARAGVAFDAAKKLRRAS